MTLQLPEPADTTGKYGLRVVRERAIYLGGTLTLSPHPDGGSALTVILPKPVPQAS